MFNNNEIELTSIEINYLKISNTEQGESSINKQTVWVYTDLDKETLDEGVEAYLASEGNEVDVDRLCSFITLTSLLVGEPCICVPKELGEKAFKKLK